jgi:hypothetical protein
MPRMNRTECFVLLIKLSDGKIRPAWYRPAPLDGDPPHLWRFVLGGIHTSGYLEIKEAQVQAKILGDNIASMRTDRLGALSCPLENIALTRILNMTAPFSVMIIPAFGPGTSLTLLDVLDKSAPADAGERSRLIH